MNTQKSANITRWVNRCIGGLLAVLFFALPKLMDFYHTLRPLSENSRMAVLVAFYCCMIPVAMALHSIEKLLQNILAGQVFTHLSVKLIRSIRGCCLAVSLICLPASVFYPPLMFLAIIMGFLSLIVTVVVNVMAAAVEMREENDLTV